MNEDEKEIQRVKNISHASVQYSNPSGEHLFGLRFLSAEDCRNQTSSSTSDVQQLQANRLYFSLN